MSNLINTIKTKIFYRYRYWFYGVIGYYVVIVLIILQAIVGNAPENPFYPIIAFLYYYPLITLKKLQGYQLDIVSYINFYESFLLILIYGILVGFICQLFFSWRNKKTKSTAIK